MCGLTRWSSLLLWTICDGQHNLVHVADVLLEYGATIDLRTDLGLTALMLAADLGEQARLFNSISHSLVQQHTLHQHTQDTTKRWHG